MLGRNADVVNAVLSGAQGFDHQDDALVGLRTAKRAAAEFQQPFDDTDGVDFLFVIDADFLEVIEQAALRLPPAAGGVGENSGEHGAPLVGGGVAQMKGAAQARDQDPQIMGGGGVGGFVMRGGAGNAHAQDRRADDVAVCRRSLSAGEQLGSAVLV